MKRAILAIFLSLCTISISAQTVSDFTGTDLEGNTHKLFEYLDAGKYIVIPETVIDSTWITLSRIGMVK